MKEQRNRDYTHDQIIAQFDEDSTATYPAPMQVEVNEQLRDLSPFAGFGYLRKSNIPIGGIRGYKGGVTFEPRTTFANIANPSAIIIKE